MLCVTLCQFKFCNHLDGEKIAGCFAQFVLLVSHDCCVTLPRGAIDLSAVCDCGISWSYSLFLNIKWVGVRLDVNDSATINSVSRKRRVNDLTQGSKRMPKLLKTMICF